MVKVLQTSNCPRDSSWTFLIVNKWSLKCPRFKSIIVNICSTAHQQPAAGFESTIFVSTRLTGSKAFINLDLIRGRCNDYSFQRFFPIFGENIGVFLENQCSDPFCCIHKVAVFWVKNTIFFAKCFPRKYYKNHPSPDKIKLTFIKNTDIFLQYTGYFPLQTIVSFFPR
jgi:hypothetical protein